MISPPPHDASGPLRARTYLAPGLPLTLFQHVCEHLSRRLDRPVELSAEARYSGPMDVADDPFARGEVDLGFVCSPSYVSLRRATRPSVQLVPAGFVFHDERHGGTPTYFSEVVVRADHPARRFADLEGGVWGFNDHCSLSGYFAALEVLADRRCGDGFFRERLFTGSHARSVGAVLAGEIDGAAIDSNTLALLRRSSPERAARLRVLETWGPYPIQPIVVRAALADELTAPLAEALLELPGREDLGLVRCAPVAPSDYDAEGDALARLGALCSADAPEP